MLSDQVCRGIVVTRDEWVRVPAVEYINR